MKALAYEGIVSGVVIAVIGAVAFVARQPWLFPSLGPTIFLQTANPDQPASRPWNTLAGHAAGTAAGFACVFLTAAQRTPPAMSTGVLTAERAAATALAVALTMVLQSLMRAAHPPAAATTMLITLGGLKATPKTVVAIAVGVVLVTLLGEGARHFHPSKVKA